MMKIPRRQHKQICKKYFSIKNGTSIKDMENLFKVKKEKEAIKGRVLRNIEEIFEHEEEHYYKPLIETLIEIKLYQLKNISIKLHLN